MESNLVKARSAIVWIVALILACAAIRWIETQTGRELIAPEQPTPAPPPAPRPEPLRAELQPSAHLPAQPAPRALTPQQMEWARDAWNYFERNLDVETGLVHSTDGFPTTTLWDTGSYLLALIAAQDLGVIDKGTFDIRVAKALVALEQLPLFAGKLPNRTYDTGTLAMTDARNQPSQQGVGWSAVDIARLLVPLNILAWRHPVHTQAARRVLARWNLAALVRQGELVGMRAGRDGRLRLAQEGRLGYEQYAARSLALMGIAAPRAADWRAHLQLVPVEGVEVCADDRDPRLDGVQNAVESEPFVLAGLEFGWDDDGRECAWRIYRAQEQRFRKTGVLTAVTEDNVDQPPFFVYNSVWSAGRPWATVTQGGQDEARLRTLSVKAAFGWDALLRTPYTARLMDKVAPLRDPQKGWFAGRYERTGLTNRALTANTNAVVLESLDFIAHGPLLGLR